LVAFILQQRINSLTHTCTFGERSFLHTFFTIHFFMALLFFYGDASAAVGSIAAAVGSVASFAAQIFAAVWFVTNSVLRKLRYNLA
jgi:hypothetical protein